MVGTLLVVGILLYLWYTGFGTRHRYDVIVNLHWERALSDLADLQGLLHRHSRRAQCASQRSSETAEGADLSYRILLRDPNRLDELLGELRRLDGVSHLTSLHAQDESEL